MRTRRGGIRSKHIEHLVDRWHADGISPGTFKNRMSALRWLAEKIDKQNIVARENSTYGIADRKHVTNVSKASALDDAKLAKVSEPTRRCRCVSRRRSGCAGKKASSCGRPSPTEAMSFT
jgi:hypothetical protein